MSLEKAIEHGKEHRKELYGAEYCAYYHRSHGGRKKSRYQCPWCLENRMHKYDKMNLASSQRLKEWKENKA